MRLYCLFGQSKENYMGEHAPELLLAWDEYCVDDNPDGWETAKESAVRNRTDLCSVKEISIEVDQAQIRSLLIAQIPTLTGKVVP